MALRIATFNIRNGDADDDHNSWPFRRHALLEKLRILNSEILGLQEVMDYQLDFLLAGMPDYRSVGVGRINGCRAGEFAPILYRPGRLILRDSGWFWLSETPETPGSRSWGTACERICTWADFSVDGSDVRIMNTHLDHVSAQARLQGVELILQRVGVVGAIVMGDFNCQPDSPPIQTMLEGGFLDSGAHSKKMTFHDWGKAHGGRIDYIFGSGVRLSPAETISAEHNGRPTSDHHIVKAVLELT